MPKRGIGSRCRQASEASRIQENTTTPRWDRRMGSSRTARGTYAALRLGCNRLTVESAGGRRALNARPFLEVLGNPTTLGVKEDACLRVGIERK